MATMGSSRMVSSETISFITFSALVAQGWDLMVHLTDEIEYLWKGKFTAIKGIYLGTRYFMLIAQIVDQVLTFYHGQKLSQESWICSGIYIFKCIIGEIALLLVETILLLKAYALSKRSLIARRLLPSVFFITMTIETIGIGLVIEGYSGTTVCGPQKASHMGMAIFGVGAVTFQFLIISTTMAKNMIEDQPARHLNPFVALISREGEVAAVTLTVLSVAIMMLECSGDKKIGIANAAFSWYIAFLSIAGSRLILNMSKPAAEHESRQDPQTDFVLFDNRDESSIPLVTSAERT